MVAIVLVVAGIFAFLNLRQVARRKAKKTAKTVAEKIARETTEQYIVTNIDAIIHEFLKAMPARGGASDDVADRIAQEESSE